MWSFFLGIIVILLPLVVAFALLWSALKKSYQDYLSCSQDSIWTDAEKLYFADSILSSIDKGKTVWSLIKTLIQFIKDKKK